MEKTSFSAYDSSEQFNGASDVCFSAISCNVYVPWISVNIRIIRCDPINTRTLHEFFFIHPPPFHSFTFHLRWLISCSHTEKLSFFRAGSKCTCCQWMYAAQRIELSFWSRREKKTQKHVTRRRSVFFPLRSEIPTHQTTKVINLNTFAN